MRCQNCGYENPPKTMRCERCNYPIDGSLNIDDVPRVPDTGTPDELAGTIRGQQVNADAWDADNQSPLDKQPKKEEPTPVPPAPGPNPSPVSSNDGSTINPLKKTFDPTRQGKGIRLMRVPRKGEEAKELPFNDEKIVLNRDNTDPGNNAITSKEQALLEKENGEWYLSNKSSLETTFIKVKGKVKLQKGDVILLGDRAFEVDY